MTTDICRLGSHLGSHRVVTDVTEFFEISYYAHTYVPMRPNTFGTCFFNALKDFQ